MLLRLTTGRRDADGAGGRAWRACSAIRHAGWLGLPAVLVYIAFNLLLASGTRSLLERQLSKRKVREFLVFVIFMLWMLPRFLFASGHRPHLTGGWVTLMQNAAWPWTAAAWAALGRSEFPALVSLAGWTLAAAWFGRTQFERNLRFDAVAAQATPYTNGVSTMQAATERSTVFRQGGCAIRWRRLSRRNCGRWHGLRGTAWSS